MAPTNMVTRCPQCGTSFRITPAQLQSARGAVRCGACLHIFKARDHLVGAQAPAAEPALVRRSPQKPTQNRPTNTKAERKPAAPKAPSPTPKEARPRAEQKPKETGLRFDQSRIDQESSALDDDDFLISDDMDQSRPESEDDPFGVGEQSRSHSTHSLFERTPRPEEEEASESGDDTDESWAMSLLEEEEEQTASVRVEPAPEPASDVPSDFELMDEPEPPPPGEHIKFHLASSDAEQVDDYQGGERMRAHDPERSALLMNIDPEPVEMNWTHRQTRRRRWLWPSLVALATVALLVQVAWLQFDRWSRMEPYRTVYATVCPLIGCQLPELVDRRQIRAYNLVVRNHPEREGALMVDAILLNTARFDQPFPGLVLEFSDLNGEVVAARQFTPEEYLSGELAGRTIMPSNQPVHLTLELVDPGPSAVNYRAYIPH